MDKTRELLIGEIDSQIQNLSVLTGDEKSIAVDDVSKLYKLKIEEDRLRAETQAKIDEQEAIKRDRKISYGITAASTAASFGFNWFWLVRILKYEETGVLRSAGFKWLNSAVKFFRK